MATLGGLTDSSSQNSVDINSLARFAVAEHNRRENVLLEFPRVVKAQEQVVAGTLHHLTLEVIEAEKKKLYEAKIWVKPWMSFQELQEFRHVGDLDDASSFNSSDLGAQQADAQESFWRSLPVHDPVVKDAANHAVTTIQQSSNSLSPYVLQEIVNAMAEAEITDGVADHPHKLTNNPSVADVNAQNEEARQLRATRLNEILELLVHASRCRSHQCIYPTCIKVQGLFRHGILCTVRSAGGCLLCYKMWYLLQLHARACKESQCSVPRCRDLKNHFAQQSDAATRSRDGDAEAMSY